MMVRSITLISLVLAFVVIIVGSYTRLTDAGLGCPDWPGCYGQVLAPTTSSEINEAANAYPQAPVDVAKAWTEMVHRYLASTLGLLILLLTVFTQLKSRATAQEKWLTRGLLGLVIFQGLLGMWTVTLKLFPLVVMSHLLGGLLTITLLWSLWHIQGGLKKEFSLSSPKVFGLICTIALFLQIALGGWTSTNYAALSCPNFPYCTQALLPSFDAHAFDLIGAIKFEDPLTYMSLEARQTIHMLHRFGALLVSLMLLALSVMLFRYTKKEKHVGMTKANTLMLFLLGSQVLLGISNVVFLLPLKVAVLHNGVAVLLFLTLVHIYFKLPRGSSHAH